MAFFDGMVIDLIRRMEMGRSVGGGNRFLLLSLPTLGRDNGFHQR
jgi:hypothetical protein